MRLPAGHVVFKVDEPRRIADNRNGRLPSESTSEPSNMIDCAHAAGAAPAQNDRRRLGEVVVGDEIVDYRTKYCEAAENEIVRIAVVVKLERVVRKSGIVALTEPQIAAAVRDENVTVAVESRIFVFERR